MSDARRCAHCGLSTPIMRPPQFIRGPRTPDEHMLENARKWAYGAFSRAEPVDADLMRGLIAALEGVETPPLSRIYVARAGDTK
jgi:hypothetical protein